MIELCWTRCVATQITSLVSSTVFALLCFTRDMHHWLTNCADYCEKQNGLTQNYSPQGASEVAGDAITGGEDGLLSLSLSLSVIITQ